MKTTAIHFFLLFSVLSHRISLAQNSGSRLLASAKTKRSAGVEAPSNAMPGAENEASYKSVLEQAWTNYKAGFKSRSVDCYIKAIGMTPDSSVAWTVLGISSEEFGRELAQDKKMLEFDPGNKIVNENLALVHYYAGQYNEALPYLEKIKKYYPSDYNNNLALGWTYIRTGKTGHAGECFKTALLSSPNDAKAMEGLMAAGDSLGMQENDVMQALAKSNVLAGRSDYKGAIALLEKVYDPSSYFINLRLGQLWDSKKSEEKARSYYSIASTLKPASSEPQL